MTTTVSEPAAQRIPSLVAFGELLLRLDAPLGDRLAQAATFEVRYTGAEANVAASLTSLGLVAEVVSAVPDDGLGEACLSFVRRSGVGTGQVRRRPGRLGLFFHEPGGAGRSPVVVYDRAGSVFATTDPSAYDWPTILAGHSWLHLSGTAPAVGPQVRAAVDDALTAARELGLGTSLDLNYRSALWDLTEAGAVLADLVRRVDVLCGAGPDAAALFGFAPPTASGPDALTSHVQLAEQLRRAFGLRAVAGTARLPAVDAQPSAARLLHGVLVDEHGAHTSRGYPLLDPVGRIGTGDAFAAGLLRGVLVGSDSTQTVEFATAAAHLKQSIRGDVNVVTVAEVEAAVVGEQADRVRR